MRAVMESDEQKALLILDPSNDKNDFMDGVCRNKGPVSVKRQKGYGSMAARDWLLQDKSAQDSSENASTCCSSSYSGDAEIAPHNDGVFSTSSSSSSSRSIDKQVIFILPNSTNRDELDLSPANDPVHNRRLVLEHQSTSITASISTSSSSCDHCNDDIDLEDGAWDSAMVEPELVCKPQCGGLDGIPGWQAYNHSLDENPVITKALTSLTGWFLGDFITQAIITGGPFDIHRSIVLASFGFFVHGPVGHVIYTNLDNIIQGNGPKQIAAKIFLDQALWCPVFMVCFFTYLGLANGDMPSMILAKIRSDLWTAVCGSWKVWILAHAIQFRYVVTKHRIIYINCVEVCFIMFLSFLGNR